jgi:hypothetical protein
MNSLVDSVHLLCSFLPLATAVTLLLSGLLALRYRWRALWLVGVFVIAINVLAGASQVYVLLHPSFDVLFLQPDPVLGWKQVPNLRWTWAGFARYADEYSVDIQTNSHGFRDLEREFEKDDRVVRVALLGASMIEAAQVSLEDTAGQVLERRLNTEPATSGKHADRYEVLNLGIAAYGTGQILLVWEEYARRFKPDYVFLFLSPLTLELTVETHQVPLFTGAARKLQARPTFRIESGQLLRSPPADTAEFIKGQEQLIRTEYGGTRSRRRHHSVILQCYSAATSIDSIIPGRPCKKDGAPAVPPPKRYSVSDEEALEVNVAILRELSRQVDAAGARLVIIDYATEAGLGSANLGGVLRGLAEQRGLGYIPFHAEIAEAVRRGISPHWQRDIHFTEAGNELLADAMYRWLAKSAPRSPAR